MEFQAGLASAVVQQVKVDDIRSIAKNVRDDADVRTVPVKTFHISRKGEIGVPSGDNKVFVQTHDSGWKWSTHCGVRSVGVGDTDHIRTRKIRSCVAANSPTYIVLVELLEQVIQPFSIVG